MAKSQIIKVQKTARYYTLGDIQQATQIWFVLHGYGQNVKRFIEKFNGLVNNTTAVIAPEGLHRFYSKGVAGDVVASWMTKEDRQNDIKDYINYLNHLKTTVCNDRQTVQVLGFSQGSATACRWVSNGLVKVHSLVLWAGILPPDLPIDDGMLNLKASQLILAHSPTDEYRTTNMWEAQQDLIDKYNLDYKEFEYEGGHRIVEDALVNMVETYVNPLLSN
jgi:predicted esterase